jgi:benzoyl-CoA 2,3-dioxygenase component A
MEEGVEKVFSTVANGIGANWKELRDSMRDEGRYHIETY